MSLGKVLCSLSPTSLQQCLLNVDSKATAADILMLMAPTQCMCRAQTMGRLCAQALGKDLIRAF